MAKKSAKKCNVINCPNLTYDTYCDKHNHLKEQQRKESHKEYRRRRTDIREQKFYTSKEWIALRNYKRNTDPLCEVCLRKGRVTPVEIVHHLIEVKEDWSKRLELSNLESVCIACHNKLHKSND